LLTWLRFILQINLVDLFTVKNKTEHWFSCAK